MSPAGNDLPLMKRTAAGRNFANKYERFPAHQRLTTDDSEPSQTNGSGLVFRKGARSGKDQ
jgi:hypothetical protein